MVADSHLIMTVVYMHAVRVFALSVILCGLVHILGYPLVAGHMLLATGCVGMAVTVGSATGYIDIIGRDGETIPPITLVSHTRMT